jgi:hypothetical protein
MTCQSDHSINHSLTLLFFPLKKYFDYLEHFLRRIQVLPEGSVEAAEAEEPPLEEATSGTGPCPR